MARRVVDIGTARIYYAVALKELNTEYGVDDMLVLGVLVEEEAHLAETTVLIVFSMQTRRSEILLMGFVCQMESNEIGEALSH